MNVRSDLRIIILVLNFNDKVAISVLLKVAWFKKVYQQDSRHVITLRDFLLSMFRIVLEISLKNGNIVILFFVCFYWNALLLFALPFSNFLKKKKKKKDLNISLCD